MYILIMNSGHEYIMLGLNDNTSSTWQQNKKHCFKYWDEDDMHTWTDVINRSFPDQLIYLESRYKVISMYKRDGNKFREINLIKSREKFPEYYL